MSLWPISRAGLTRRPLWRSWWGIVVLGGRLIAVGLFSYRTYFKEKKAADEARAELRALEAEEQAEAAPRDWKKARLTTPNDPLAGALRPGRP